MSSPSRTPAPSVRFKSILDDALNKYKQRTGKDLPAQWSATGLTSCESVDAVLGILQGQAKALEQTSAGNQKLMNGIWLSVDVLSMVSATLREGFSLAFPPAKVIVTGISVLLSAAKGVKASHDALIDLFGRIEDFFMRFKIYIQSSPTAEWEEVLVRVVAEVLHILSIATKEMEQSKAKKYFKRLLGRTDIEDALRKLDSLIQGEHGMVTAQILKATSELKDDVEKIVAAIQQMQKNRGEEEWKQIQKGARRWFSPPDPSTNHNIAWKAYHEGTATWFFEGSVFVDWMSIGSLLWVHGKPGSGKSILCSAFIQHIMALYDPGQATLLYYYFDFRDEEKKNARNLITSLLVQLSAFSDPCCDVISNLFLTHGKGARKPTDDALTKCLKQMLSIIAEHPTYIIIDALDECPDDSGWPKTARAEVLRVVKDLVGLHFPNLRICVTSRPEVDIKSILNQLAIHTVSLHDESEQQEGIADYVSTIVNSDEKMREWPDEDKELVVKVLSERADGMFRWVVCQLETLRRSAQRNVRGILEKLPKTLDETYERVLKEINEDNREHARRLLHCLAVAVRPLRVEELAEILAFDFDGAQGGIPEFHAGWQRKDQERAVLFTCSSLITVVDGHIHDEEDDEEDDSNDSRVFRLVQFSHFSVKEFLMSNRLASSTRGVSQYHILPGSAHTILAQACLGILLRLDNPDHTRNVNDFPLTEYAAQHWVTHAQFENVASRVKDGMESLFDPDKPHFTAWVNIYNIDGVILWKSFKRYETQIPTPLYYSALCGFHDLAKHLLFKDPQHARAIGGRFDFPLVAALYGKHIQVAELLLKNGANINARGTCGQTPLSELFNNDETFYNIDDDDVLIIAKLLLERGADVNLTDEYLQTPLLLAISSRRYDVARLLLQHGANEKVEDDMGRSPLHLLMGFSDSSSEVPFAQLLLERGMDVNAKDKNHETPLFLAMDQGNSSMARFLLQHGADDKVENNKGQTPLHRLSCAYSSMPEFAQLLLERGADVHAKDQNHATPLLLALRWGSEAIVRLLLRHGANDNVITKDGKTPLHMLSESCRHSMPEIALLLLERGADVNAKDKNYATPLLLAIREGKNEIAWFLLDHGADVNVVTNWGETPLHCLSARYRSRFEPCELSLAQILLERGADVNAKDKNGATPFLLALREGKGEIAQLLFQCGADDKVEDDKGKTPLHVISARSGSRVSASDVPSIQFLLDAGADVNAKDKNDATPLLLAIAKNNYKIAWVLLQHGADVNVVTNVGETPLHILSKGRYSDVPLALFLLECGADGGAQDDFGNTPLHVAADGGNISITRVLLDHAEIEDERNQPPVHPVLKGYNVYVNARNTVHESPLHLASLTGMREVARALLEHGAKANAEDIQGDTPLHIVSGPLCDTKGDDIGVAKLLLKHGANVRTRNEDHKTPLALALHNQKQEIARMLLDYAAKSWAKNDRGETPLQLGLENRLMDMIAREGDEAARLHLPSYYGQPKIMWVLLDHGADANVENVRGETPLHVVSRGQYDSQDDGVEVVRLLLQHGADVNAHTKSRTAPLQLASYYGRIRIARVLLYNGANANTKNELGQTPLHQVLLGNRSCRDSVDVVQLLLERGADVNAQDLHNDTPLHLASKFAALEFARVLLTHDASPAAANLRGQTPLHALSVLPTRFGDEVRVAQLLLERGADINAGDADQETPLHFATRNNRLDLARYLLMCGADTNANNNNGETPFLLALRQGDDGMRRLLSDYVVVGLDWGNGNLVYSFP